MVRPDWARMFQKAADGLFKLGFSCIAVSGQSLLGLTNRHFNNRHMASAPGKQNDARYFAQGDTGLWKLFQGKNILDNNEVRLFIFQDRKDFFINMIKAVRQCRVF